ncbi:hypothetical protein [Propioniciclava soli]|uniref:hypothetical protein n=1 Tax=Propioniciclava soli TaxID=2775081 RepID=UPI001E4B8BFD|nr:hypothetical protein [Propioniciclava soli]
MIALLDAEHAGRTAHPSALGSADDAGPVLAALASDPLAPLAARALVSASDADPNDWRDFVREFAAGLDLQTSVLALQESVDALLGGPAAAAAGPALHDAMLAGLDDVIGRAPIVAAARLEAAVRTAIAGLARPFLVLDRLAAPPDAFPEDYVDALPRLIGIALEVWGADDRVAEPLTSVLNALAGTPAEGDAAHELACRQMRRALSTADASAAVDGLADAAAMFSRAQALDGERDDSAAYGAGCEAVIAFARADWAAVAASAQVLAGVMSRRAAWHLGVHQPAWRAGAEDAETAWLAFVLDLRQAADRLGEESWLDASAAAGQLAAVYEAERAINPAPGVLAAVRPSVASGVARKAVLLGQLERMVANDLASGDPVLPPATADVLAAARVAAAEGTSAASWRETGRGAAIERVRRLAPSLLALGDDVCQQLAGLDDEVLHSAEAVAAPLQTRSTEHPTLARMRDSVVAALEVNPRFVGEARVAMTALLKRTLSFLLDRYDRGGPLMHGMKNIISVPPKGEPLPVEADLQYEFYVWLAGPWEFAGRVRAERSGIATGRADITVRFGDIELVTEVKRELADATPQALERSYLGQAAEYSGSGEPFSQLLVLDVTDHSAGVRPLPDLAWVAERRADPGASPQHVVVAVVVGNRPTPRRVKGPSATERSPESP